MAISSWREAAGVLRVGGAGATAFLLLILAAGEKPEATSVSQWGTGTVLAEIASAHPDMATGLRAYETLFASANKVSSPIPANPETALIGASERLSAALGFAQEAGPAIRAAKVPPEIAGRMALLLDRMHACHLLTARHHEELVELLPKLFRQYSVLASLNYPDIAQCAPGMWAATGDLEHAIAAAQGPQDPGRCAPLSVEAVDLWPVLRFEPACGAQTYRNDYLLVVDVGGDDTYSNNVGSNVMDINFSPPGAAVAGVLGSGPAKGCQRGLSGLFRKDCLLSAAVLLDMQGNDNYGVLETPDSDRICTNDPVVRRMLTGGAAFLGVGILRDATPGKDQYFGKTISLGAGHMFGVGILSDAGGDDTYRAVRNSQGFALMGGLGLLHDEGGNDSYGYYMPRPLDPNAPNQSDGAGGVRDNEGDGVCDRIPRYTLGGGNMMGAAGVLVDEGGDDAYHGAFTDVYETNPPIPGMSLAGGSMGFGGNGALGVFLDRGGRDTYKVDNVRPGMRPRADAVLMRPGDASTDAAGKGLFAGGGGIFIDR